MKEENGRKSKKAIADVRLSVTGASYVGKSAITVRFLTRRFIGEYQPNVEQTYKGIINFGTDTIKYDLKDSSRSPDKTSMMTWSTCIAVIYSITDPASFQAASIILDDIDRALQQGVNYKKLTPCIALIGNKNDLEHLRKVESEDGRRVAEKYGAGFWEVSASEDYYSTFQPLNSLIVESFLNAKNGKNSPNSRTSSPSSSSSGNETKTINKTLSALNPEEIARLLRRKSEPCYDTIKIETDINIFEAEYHQKQKDDGDNLMPSNSSPNINAIKRRRKTPRQEQKKSIDKCAKRISSPPSSTPSTPSTTTPPPPNIVISNSRSNSVSGITIEVTDTSNEETQSPVKRNNRSQSWSKNDKKRVIQRKSTDQKNAGLLDSISLPKSRSFTDLKTLGKNCNESRVISSSKSAMVLNGEDDIDEVPGNKLNNKENLCIGDSPLFKSIRSASTSSFSKLAALESSKNYWNRLRKERRKLLTLSLEQVYDNNSAPVKILDPPIDKSIGTINGRRHMGKKSVRRKISSIFLRPRSISGSP